MENSKDREGTARDRQVSTSAQTDSSNDGGRHHIQRMQAALSWRHELLNDILRVAAPAGVALTALVIGFRSPIYFDSAAAIVAAAATLVVALRLLPRIPFTLRAALTVLIIYGSALPTVFRSGFALSSGGVLMAAIVLAVILLGRGVALGLLITTAGILVWLGWEAQTGHFVPHPIESNPHLARNWYRMAIGMDIAAATLASMVAYAVRHIEDSYAEISAALALLTDERRRRSTLQNERHRLDRDWARAARELGTLAKNADLAAGNVGLAFRAISEAGARGLGVDRCGVWLFDETHRELRCRDLFARTKGLHAHDLRLAFAEAPAFFAAIERDRVIAVDLARLDARTRKMENGYLGRFDVRSLLCAPIRVQGRVVGGVWGEEVGTPLVWSDAQQSFAGALADMAGRALSAAERNRRVLALWASTKELAEMLDALKVWMAGIPTGTAAWRAAGQPRSLYLVDVIAGRVRNMSSELSAPSLDEVGLVAALRANLDTKAAESGVTFELDASRLTGPGSPETETACFWIIEELVANILTRSDTHSVQIRLERQEGTFHVTVEDDGSGTPTNPGFPIWARGPIVRVRERAGALGGSVDVTTCEGAGSLVEIHLPDPPAERVAATRPPSELAVAPGSQPMRRAEWSEAYDEIVEVLLGEAPEGSLPPPAQAGARACRLGSHAAAGAGSHSAQNPLARK